MSLAPSTHSPHSSTSFSAKNRRSSSSCILPQQGHHYLPSSQYYSCTSLYNHVPQLRHHLTLDNSSSCKPLLPLPKATPVSYSSAFFSAASGHHHRHKDSVPNARQPVPGTEGNNTSVVTAYDHLQPSSSPFSFLDGIDFSFLSSRQEHKMDQPSSPSSSLSVTTILPVNTFVGEVFRKECSLHPTPFYLYDEARIRYNCRRLLSAFSWVGKAKRCLRETTAVGVTIEKDPSSTFGLASSASSSASPPLASAPIAGNLGEKPPSTSVIGPSAHPRTTTAWHEEQDQQEQKPICKENGFILVNRDDSDHDVHHEKKTQRTNGDDKTSTCFTNFFAVKATPTPAILQIVKEEGCGVDCSSLSELLLAEAVGFRGEDIFFTSNDTPAEDFLKAYELGAIINLDDESHLQFLRQTLGKRRLPSILCFRLNPSEESRRNTVQSNPLILGQPNESKFGMTHPQLFSCLTQARVWGVRRFGLHAMILSNSLSTEEVVETARLLFSVAVEVKKTLDIDIELINLGGGLGIPYRPDDKPLDLHEVSSQIHSLFNNMLATEGLGNTRVVMENGRFLTGDAAVLVTRVLHHKQTYKNFIGVDACMAHLMRPGMYGSYHHITLVPGVSGREDSVLPSKAGRTPFDVSQDEEEIDVSKGESAKKSQLLFDVVGGLCENNDKFAVDRSFPVVPQIGDLLLIHDVGAHGHSMCFNYNGRLRCAEYLYRMRSGKEGGETLQIRRAETFDDLFATVTGLRHPGGLSLLLTLRMQHVNFLSSFLLGKCRCLLNVFHTYFLRLITRYRCLHSLFSIEDRIKIFITSSSPFLSLMLLSAPIIGGGAFLWYHVLRQHVQFPPHYFHRAFHSGFSCERIGRR